MHESWIRISIAGEISTKHGKKSWTEFQKIKKKPFDRK